MKTIFHIIALFISIHAFSQKEFEWPIKTLDTARDVTYLSDTEKNVILEMNRLRYNPTKYAEQYMEWMSIYYSKKLLEIPGKKILKTEEGIKAFNECIETLKETHPSPILKPSRGMAKACELLSYDQGLTGAIGHKSSGNSDPFDRANRFGSFIGHFAENIHYGDCEPRFIIISLLIDDGVRSRGHRKTLLSKDYNYTGIAIGKHKIYGEMCVINYATKFNDK